MRLLDLHVDALWCRDSAGFLTVSNEPEPEAAPRLYVGRDDRGHLVHTGYRLAPAERDALRAIPPERLFADRELVVRVLVQGGPCMRIWQGPAFSVAAPVPKRSAPDVRLLGVGDAALLERYVPGRAAEYLLRSPLCAVVVEHEIRALCFSSRITGMADEAGVETAEAWRRRGYGRQAVLGWARAVQQQGKIALYSTSWDNAASRGLAHSLGLVQYGEDMEYY